MSTKTLSLNDVVNVVVQVGPLSAPRNAFNLGLIIGAATIIPVADRVRLYTGTGAMLSDGFKSTDQEYIAAQLYFSQKPTPRRLLVGRMDKTAQTPETPLVAFQACRDANNEWYAGYVCGATKTDIQAIAAYAETAQPSTTYFYTTQDADVLTNVAGNIFAALKAANYGSTIGQYSSTNAHAAAAIMGYAMGANTGLRKSAYTLAHKKEVGVTVESLDPTSVGNIEANNGNVYVNRGSYYDMFEPGVMANGVHFDEIINLDKLSNDIQLSIMDALYQNPKIPQTEEGILILISAVNTPCQQAADIGFVAPGVWNGEPILNLKVGDTLPKGYLVQSDAIASQSQADRDARKAPPIYAAIKLAGAIEHVIIGVIVNR